MLGIFAKSFMTATRAEDQHDRRVNTKAPKPQSWLDEDLPFRRFAGSRTGRDD